MCTTEPSASVMTCGVVVFAPCEDIAGRVSFQASRLHASLHWLSRHLCCSVQLLPPPPARRLKYSSFQLYRQEAAEAAVAAEAASREAGSEKSERSEAANGTRRSTG